jgi:broad specificity phosphatase PhoE
VLVVCHLAVLRCIFAYFMGTKLEEVPFKPFARHIIYELKPGATRLMSDILVPSVSRLLYIMVHVVKVS